eukprot:scaffold212_cov174-Ochromonas_danica.AAC.10
MRIYTAIGSTAFFIFRFLVLCTSGKHLHNLFASKQWNCTRFEAPEAFAGLLLFPVVFSGIFREVNVRIFLCLWAASVVALFVGVHYGEREVYYSFLAMYIIPSLVIIFETYRYNRSITMFTMALRQTLKEKEENADQVHATEMRHMIANVAHDLKTPLTSFLSGIEIISDISLETQRKIKEDGIDANELNENISSVLKCVTNIRNTNSFMLMTINRCIDYTKASKGLKLIPKHETIDLVETLLLPLNCMKDIQQRVSIVLEPIPPEICSHVITDKQWLQENVLCLLSNAVKYSSGGEVKVELKIIDEEPSRFTDEQTDDTLLGKACTMFGVGRIKGRKSDIQVAPLSIERSQSSEADFSVLSRFRNASYDSSSTFNRPRTWSEYRNCSSYLCIEVEDHGIGLSEDAMSNLFSPFKQAQRLAGGTGLGLYSLARRVEALNGFYGVSNRRDGGQGCLFWFSIPYRPDCISSGSIRKSLLRRQDLLTSGSIDGDATALASSSCDAGGTGSRGIRLYTKDVLDEDVSCIERSKKGDSMKNLCDVSLDILVVDDSPAIVKMTSMMLRRLGHRITIAENGDVALKKIFERMENSQTPFDVVLMDLQMPVMDGLEATRRLRFYESVENKSSQENNQEGGPSSSSPCRGALHQIVLGVSANSDHETMQDALNAGIDGFMGKPFTIETFYDTYERAKENLHRVDHGVDGAMLF